MTAGACCFGLLLWGLLEDVGVVGEAVGEGEAVVGALVEAVGFVEELGGFVGGAGFDLDGD